MATLAPTTQAPARRPRDPRRIRRILWSAVAIIAALIWVFPVYWMVSSSLLPNRTLMSFIPTFFPGAETTFANYRNVVADGSFFSALGMSVSITLIVVVCCLIFAFLAAIAISRYKFRGRKSFVLAVLLVQMLPAEGLFIAQYKMISSVGLLNSIIGVSVIYIAAVVPFTIWMLRGFVAGIPAELEEAAMVDGLSRPQAFMRITFPLLAPGLVASGVFAFLQAWNEFTVALVILQSNSSQTLPLWLRGFIQNSASREIDWGQVMASSTLVAVPVIIFFLIVQGRMTSGLVGGAVKG
ncbi:ABC transporter permease subunit [Klugiella xanthotipulae]|uniref:Carbohydrate ABC transporter membrane protein 2 (CUT1 family) n=1 Tax=Klugiella xanthotipulae TaxID=244735 RepID=A0A543I544_9MICO|nr:carbohydrate ABC transporter permease [Klugiella xanthotipulae]TQM65689.1 carbohydrate ABC transporter membrane protein 2 (CUT1 family) [Klugiella xanthotipulae]